LKSEVCSLRLEVPSARFGANTWLRGIPSGPLDFFP
jgi:hypothetical protein